MGCNQHMGSKTTLTPKQEAFALAYVETGNASEAYRRAYNAVRMKPAVVTVKASELLAHGNVAVRVKELQAAHIERHEITVDDLLRELEEARTAASNQEKPQAAAMVAATMGKAKLLGMLTDKTELTGADGGPVQLEDRQVAARLAALAAVAKARKQGEDPIGEQA